MPVYKSVDITKVHNRATDSMNSSEKEQVYTIISNFIKYFIAEETK